MEQIAIQRQTSHFGAIAIGIERPPFRITGMAIRCGKRRLQQRMTAMDTRIQQADQMAWFSAGEIAGMVGP